MRRNAKIDANHNDVADYLRANRWSVFSTAALGRGFPDLVVGVPGFAALVEIKDGRLPPSARDLTADERKFAERWTGPYVLGLTPEQTLRDLERARAEVME